jgi:aminopeptidase-like protein
MGGYKHAPEYTMALLWVMNLADGQHSLLEMAERANLPFALIADAAQSLQANGLLVG